MPSTKQRNNKVGMDTNFWKLTYVFYMNMLGKVQIVRLNMDVIGLVQCGAQKKATAAPAKDLYISSLFKKSKSFVESKCDKWFILSAKYGLLLPEQVVEPYNETLKSYSVKERAIWAESIFEDISKHINSGDKIIFLAGNCYGQFLIPKLQAMGIQIEVPMKGLRIGEQLHYLDVQNQRNNYGK